MPINHRILSCSKDPYLLRIRHWALEYAFFEVVDEYGADALENLDEDDFDVVLICHSFSETEQCRVREIVGRRWPAAAVLNLHRHWIGCSCSQCMAAREVDYGAQNLLVKVACKVRLCS